MVNKQAVQKKLLAIVQEELQQAIDGSIRLAEAIKEIDKHLVDVSITVITAVDILERSDIPPDESAESRTVISTVSLDEKDRQFLQSLRLSY